MILDTLILIILLEDVKFKIIKKLILLLLFIPLVSFGQMDYYVSAKGGLNVREAPEAKAKKVSTLSYGTFVSIESRTALKLTINDTNEETGIKKQIEGEWVKIISEKGISGYVFDGYLIQFKPHPWTVFTTVSEASLNIKEINLKSNEIDISFDISTNYYKKLNIGETIQFVPLDKDLPNLKFRVLDVKESDNQDLDYKLYIVKAKIIKNIIDKYLSLNKDWIRGLVVHPPVKGAKFLGDPNVLKDINEPMLDFDNDGNPDFRIWDKCLIFKEGEGLVEGNSYEDNCDKDYGGTEILINNKWIKLVEFVPM